MKSNTVWKNDLQFFNNIIISWKHSLDGKNWFKTNDFLLLLPYSRVTIYIVDYLT